MSLPPPNWRPEPQPEPQPLEEGEYELRLPDARIYDPEADSKIVAWRTLCFMGLGFGVVDASALAVLRDIDRQYVADICAAGCPPHVAMEILL